VKLFWHIKTQIRKILPHDVTLEPELEHRLMYRCLSVDFDAIVGVFRR